MKKGTERMDWVQLGDLVCAILGKIRDNPRFFEAAARERGIEVEQLTAAAIIQAIRERVEAAPSGGAR